MNLVNGEVLKIKSPQECKPYIQFWSVFTKRSDTVSSQVFTGANREPSA